MAFPHVKTKRVAPFKLYSVFMILCIHHVCVRGWAAAGSGIQKCQGSQELATVGGFRKSKVRGRRSRDIIFQKSGDCQIGFHIGPP